MLQPSGWPRPKGYANGIKARGDLLFVGGMVGWDERGRFPADFVGQTRQVFSNIIAVLIEGGASARDIVRMTWYVLDKQEYLARRGEIGAVWREVLGRTFPAMALVQVAGLVEDRARLEIETTALVPDEE